MRGPRSAQSQCTLQLEFSTDESTSVQLSAESTTEGPDSAEEGSAEQDAHVMTTAMCRGEPMRRSNCLMPCLHSDIGPERQSANRGGG